jgi:malonyl-CoA O-methyltransferase
MTARISSRPATVAELADSFGRAASNYGRYACVQTAMAAWLAEWLPTDRRGQALEMGAGTGGFTRHLLPWRGRLVASDLAPAMCAAGRAAVPQVEWREMAAEVPNGGPWDWIFSNAMLQWVAQPGGLFAAWNDRLAPGGRVLGGLFVAESLPELNDLLREESPIQWRTVDHWRRYLEEGGFRIVRDSSVPRTFFYPSAIALLRSLHGVGAAPVRRIAPLRLRRVLQEYERRHAVVGGVSATWTFYRFEAERAAGDNGSEGGGRRAVG